MPCWYSEATRQARTVCPHEKSRPFVGGFFHFGQRKPYQLTRLIEQPMAFVTAGFTRLPIIMLSMASLR